MTRLEILNEEDIKRIHEATLDILESTGVWFNKSEEAIKLFRENGCTTTGSFQLTSGSSHGPRGWRRMDLAFASMHTTDISAITTAAARVAFATTCSSIPMID